MFKDRESLARSIAMYATIILAMILLGGAYRVIAAPAVEPPERPKAALLAVSWNTAVMTQATNATASTSQSYAYHDLACEVDAHDHQVVTVTIQASLDNSDWFNVVVFSPIGTDTVASTGIFTRLLSYGRYERARFTVSNTTNITPVCKSVFFSNWSPPAYTGEMAR